MGTMLGYCAVKVAEKLATTSYYIRTHMFGFLDAVFPWTRLSFSLLRLLNARIQFGPLRETKNTERDVTFQFSLGASVGRLFWRLADEVAFFVPFVGWADFAVFVWPLAFGATTGAPRLERFDRLRELCSKLLEGEETFTIRLTEGAYRYVSAGEWGGPEISEWFGSEMGQGCTPTTIC